MNNKNTYKKNTEQKK